MSTRHETRTAHRLPLPARAAVSLENDERLDPAVHTMRELTAPLGDSSTGDALRGRWLGHALHPLLTDLPLGLWTATTVLDLVGGEQSRPAAQRLVGLGVLAVAPTAASGWAEWQHATPREQRVGVAHAALNVTGAVLYAGSWAARRRDRHRLGAALALAGAGAAGVAGYLGGHLTSARKVSSRHPAFDDAGPAPLAHDGQVTSSSLPAPVESPSAASYSADPVTGDDVADALLNQQARVMTMVEHFEFAVRDGRTEGLPELFAHLAVSQALVAELVEPHLAAGRHGLDRAGQQEGLAQQIANLEHLEVGSPGFLSQLALIEDALAAQTRHLEGEGLAAATRHLNQSDAERALAAVSSLTASPVAGTDRFAELLDRARRDVRAHLSA